MSPKRALLAKTAGGVAAAAGAALTVGAGPLPAALAASIPSLVELAFGNLHTRNDKRVTRLFEELMAEPRFAELLDAPSGTAPLLLATMLEEPGFEELLARALKELLAAVSSTAVKPLALLVREYVRDGRAETGPDEFFRGAAALFASLDAEQFEALRELLVRVAERVEECPQVEIRQGELYFPTQADSANGHQAEGPSLNRWRRLFHRLKTEALAFDNPSGFFNLVSGPDVLRMERAVARRLLSLLAN